MAGQQIYIGTSSWKYEGWCGQIYTRDRYTTRGRFAQKRFESECLAEYAETFPVVCGDFTFYQFPAEPVLEAAVHIGGTRFAIRVQGAGRDHRARVPAAIRAMARGRGTENPSFLNADLFRSAFTDLLAPYRARVPVLIFEFGTFDKSCYEDADAFVQDLDPFLSKLPDGFRYAVEIRNPDYLVPEYFDCLRHHGVAHVFNAWSRMPEIDRQIQIPEAWTADFVVTRALLRCGRPYEEAVERFSPYERIQDENPGARGAIREMIRTAREQNRRAYIYVNNRLEGNAPSTIEAILEDD